MSANAPYYQIRASQFINATHDANALQPQLVPGEPDYELPASAAVALPPEHTKSLMYAEPSVHAQPISADPTYENHNFAELLEAASSAVATGQVAREGMLSDQGEANMAAHGDGSRKRTSSSPASDVGVAGNSLDSKRRRVHVPTDPQLQEAEHSRLSEFERDGAPYTSESLLRGDRAAGVHSAAALFRRSSERTSRKYTRPPMSKLFMSLQLSPEAFLHLQAQAKSYMLDTTHPERQSCVGNRGKGDTDMVKLRLFNCVRDFLNDQAGEQFFGEHVKKPGEKEAIEAARALGEEQLPTAEGRLTWPRDGNKIISLVTPLMRRMVTNERQRQYAIETRRGGTKKSKEASVEAVATQVVAAQDDEQQRQSPLGRTLAPQLQRSQPTSPLLMVDSTPSPVQGRASSHSDRNEAGPKSDPSWSTQMQSSPYSSLPTACPVEPNLSHINIFLVLAPRSGKPAIKLNEKRLFAERPSHLTFYDWHDFLKEVHALLSTPTSQYPELSRRLTPPKSNIGPGTLRGLAAAANALQSPVPAAAHPAQSPSNGVSTAPTKPPDELSTPASTQRIPAELALAPIHPPPLLPTPTPTHNELPAPNAEQHVSTDFLPRHAIKTLASAGWTHIHTEHDWYRVLREKAFAVWADGVCNVLVEIAGLAGDVAGDVAGGVGGGLVSR